MPSRRRRVIRLLSMTRHRGCHVAARRCTGVVEACCEVTPGLSVGGKEVSTAASTKAAGRGREYAV